MNKFLEKYNLPKLNQEEIDNLNIPITSMESKSVIKNLSSNKNKAQDQMAYSPSWLLWTPGENKRGSTKRHLFGEEGEDGWERWFQEDCEQRRAMFQASRGEGVSRGGVNGQEELGWVQLTLTLLWTSVDMKSSSFLPGYLQSAVP